MPGSDSHRIRGAIEAPIVRLALFAAGLALLAGVAALAGRASGIDGDSADSSGGMVEHGAPGEETGAGNGLSDTASGLRLLLTPTTVARGASTRLDLRIVDDNGTAITDFDESHDEPPIHLILVRRDLTGYQHLHPVRAGDGFTVDLTLAEPGAWRAYADFERDGEKTVLGRDLVVPGSFVPRALPAPARSAAVDEYLVRLGTGELRAGAESTVEFSITRAGRPVELERDGEKTVLGRDLVVPGSFVPRALPAPASTSQIDDYRVRLETGELRAGAESTVEFTITRAGQPVELEPYLGADGHLVAIREDDLAYLHVHPLEGSPASGVAFDAEFADPGRYALFLQFRDEGRVRTVSFTVEVAG